MTITLDCIKNIVAGDTISVKGEIYKVHSVSDLYLNDYLLTFVELHKEDYTYFLLFKEYNENEYEFELFYELEDFPQGEDRESVMEQGFAEIFSPPLDPHDYKPCELYLAIDLYDSNDIRYRQHIDTVYGEISIDEGQYQLCALNLWETNEDVENPKILCLEIGGIDNNGNPLDEGPQMYMYKGNNIEAHLIGVEVK